MQEQRSVVAEHLAAAQAAAYAAAQSGSWLEAANLYEAIRARHPHDGPAHVYGGWALREAGRVDEAEALLARAVTLLPADLWAHIHFALCATHTGRWADAAERFTAIRERWPEHATGHIEGGWALREAGDVEGAERLLGEAARLFPGEPQVWFHFALNAEARLDWPGACERWTRMLAASPQDGRAREGLQRCTYMRGFARVANLAERIEAGAQLPMAEPDWADEIAAGITHFESLGDSCEFGFVQRHFGFEPLSLLRWAATTTDRLILGVETGFAGIASPENTYANEEFSEEYVITNKTYFQNIYTHVRRTRVDDEAQFLRQMRSGLARLAEKLLEDLTLCEKIFVHRSLHTIDAGKLQRLAAALRRHGPAKLLIVQAADDSHPSGRLDWLDELTARAYLPLRANLAEEAIDFDAWARLCTQVWDRWRSETA